MINIYLCCQHDHAIVYLFRKKKKKDCKLPWTRRWTTTTTKTTMTTTVNPRNPKREASCVRLYSIRFWIKRVFLLAARTGLSGSLPPPTQQKQRQQQHAGKRTRTNRRGGRTWGLMGGGGRPPGQSPRGEKNKKKYERTWHERRKETEWDGVRRRQDTGETG